MVRLPRGNMAVVSSLIRNFLVNRLDAHPELCEVTNDEIQELRAKSYNATLIRRIDITSDLARFQIRPDGGVAAFKPGQYVALGLGYWEPRIQPSQAEEMDAAKLKKMVRRHTRSRARCLMKSGS